MLGAVQCEASTSGRGWGALGSLGRELVAGPPVVARCQSKWLLRLAAPGESFSLPDSLLSTRVLRPCGRSCNQCAQCRLLPLPLCTAMVHRLPRRHLSCSAMAAQPAAIYADERAAAGLALPKRVVLMVEPSPFTSVCWGCRPCCGSCYSSCCCDCRATLRLAPCLAPRAAHMLAQAAHIAALPCCPRPAAMSAAT